MPQAIFAHITPRGRGRRPDVVLQFKRLPPSPRPPAPAPEELDALLLLMRSVLARLDAHNADRGHRP